MPLRALHCGFCFSHWAAAVCIGIAFVPIVGIWILAWLAVVRASNLLNDITKTWSRTPGTRAPQEILKEVPTEYLEEEFIRRTSHPFGIPIGAVPASRPEATGQTTSP